MATGKPLSVFISNEISCMVDSAPPMEMLVGNYFHVMTWQTVAYCCSALRSLRSQICARIEVLVTDFLQSLVATEPSICPLPMVCRTAKNTQLRGGSLGGGNLSIVLLQATFEKKFTRKSGGKSFLRVWKVIQICYNLLQLDKRATQRELFYRLLCDPSCHVTTPQQVNDAIQDAVALLKCSRHSLGIIASSRGVLVGRLLIEYPDGRTIDCSKLGPNPHVITGDISFLHKLRFQSDARYILLVEKAEDLMLYNIPTLVCMLSTRQFSKGDGFPKVNRGSVLPEGTQHYYYGEGLSRFSNKCRVVLRLLNESFPTLPIFALVDWNPAGLAIVCTYKFGSIRMGLETPHHACDVKWLGLRSKDLQYIPREAMLNLKGRDKTLAKSLLASKMLQNHELHRDELQKMLETGKRVEIEALYSNGCGFLCKFVTQKIVEQDFI